MTLLLPAAEIKLRMSKMTKNIVKLSPNIHCLVVEDNEVRHSWFQSVLPNFEIAPTPEAAIDAINQGDYDIVFLDHDCVPLFMDPVDPEYLTKTFWTVAQHMRKIEYSGTVVIHSGNIYGAARMAALLRETNPQVYVMPFGTFDVKVE